MSQSNAIKIVIPARLHSTRLPEKPLLLLAGKPLIWHTYQCALAADIDPNDIVIASEDAAVVETAQAFGAQAMLTADTHATGSARCLEVAQQLDWSADTIVVNLQGDEPFLPAGELRQVINALIEHPEAAMATLAAPLQAHAASNPHCVKVVLNAKQYAMYFSRAAVPYHRQDNLVEPLPTTDPVYLQHIGLYAYRHHALAQLQRAPATVIETMEQLEQLRALYYQMPIFVAKTTQIPHGSIDTPYDLDLARKTLATTAI
ncbi:MAG: 3-deoxy-manno-octulosonate cytidylyltransferase [Shewanellaceae bacterium]|nr:3-deoxy-manno-octulosonate cytidylyltransferase [Shewanellaceae bacterium]